MVASATILPAASHAARSGGVNLSNVKLNAHWKQGWLTASVHFTVTSSGPATLVATVRPVAPGPVAAVGHYTFSQAGSKSESLKLPARLLPRDYVLKVGDATARFTVPTPPEGVVDSAIVSTTPSGPAAHAVPAVKTLYVRFHFLVPPPGAKQVKIEWRTPSFTFVGAVTKPYATTVVSSLSSGSPLPAGTWYAILMVGGKIAKEQDVRVG